MTYAYIYCKIGTQKANLFNAPNGFFSQGKTRAERGSGESSFGTRWNWSWWRRLFLHIGKEYKFNASGTEWKVVPTWQSSQVYSIPIYFLKYFTTLLLFHILSISFLGLTTDTDESVRGVVRLRYDNISPSHLCTCSVLTCSLCLSICFQHILGWAKVGKH